LPETTTTQPELLGAIGDFVWLDVDEDGFQDAGEAPVAGVTVRLYDAGCDTLLGTTVTDAAGKYLFADLPAGTYCVEFVVSTLPAKHVITGPDRAADDADSDGDETTGRTADIVLAAGQVDLTWDLGIWTTQVSPTTITTTSTTIAATTVTTTAETLPRTGFGQGDVGGLGLVLLVLGGFILLAIRRTEDVALAENPTRTWEV
jgi:LPXTG-motif cell wall-anchored protein